ncbi:MAG: hypothetical protein HY084_07335 [Gemmatimonadetes bacterium]|nr:hypothetical protein [Gemmatimonadota bacterium]
MPPRLSHPARSTRRRLLAAASTLFALSPLGAQSLRNSLLEADFGPRGLTSITTLADHRIDSLRSDDFALSVANLAFESTNLPAPTRHSTAHSVSFTYDAKPFAITVTYELKSDWTFVSKQITLTSDTVDRFVVDSITPFATTFAETPTGVFRPTSVRPSLGTADYGAAVRFGDDRSLLIVAQNPFLHADLHGNAFSLRYTPQMEWQKSYGPFHSDRAFIAPVRLSGHRLPAHMIPEWRTAGDTTAGLDEAEIAAFTAMVRSQLLYRPATPIDVFVGWCVNDYQIDVGTAAGRAEYKRVFDQAAAVGAQYVLYAPSNSALSRREESVDDWSWEHVLWLGLGQKIRKGEWDAKTSTVPPSVSEMVDYARGKRLRLLAYVYPVLPFSQNPDWLVPSRNNPKRQAATLGNRALQDWLIEQLVAFHDRTGIAGYSFDHTFLTFDGPSRYAQWYGWRRVMEELRRRIPDVVIDGRQAYHLYGPWSWLAGSYPHPTFNDEQPESFLPYPDLHFDRVSADRERWTAYRYRNYEFTPSELVPGFITHQTSRSDSTDEMPAVKTADRGTVLTSYRARDWDYLGWRYSLLSSVAVAGWNNVLDMLPARDSAENAHFSEKDRAWMRRWLQWTATHKELLRHTRTILGAPALGKVDGTAAIDGDHGFIFLFNPDARRLTARVPLDASIGLTYGARVAVREVHPLEGRRLGKPGAGFWQRGDTMSVMLDGGSALVLELSPAGPMTAPVLFGAPGTATVKDGVLDVRGASGESGTNVRLEIALPHGATGQRSGAIIASVRRARVNGVEVPVAARNGDVVQLEVTFAGAEFRQLQPAVTYDSTFAGGRVSGTFTIPKRVFEQLAARRHAWPIPWTADDYRTTWLAPERLLLFAPFSEPDDRWEATLSIDGAPVEFRKAYTAVRVVRSTFVGFYADVSRLEPDRPYRFELQLPSLKPGQFRGLYFENVEPQYVSTVALPR